MLLPKVKVKTMQFLQLVNDLPEKIIPFKIKEKIENPEDYNPEVIIIGYPDITQTYDIGNFVRNYTVPWDSTLFQTNEIYKGMSGGPVIEKESGKVIGIVSKKEGIIVKNQDGDNIINDQDGLSYHEKVQQVFSDPNASHINW